MFSKILKKDLKENNTKDTIKVLLSDAIIAKSYFRKISIFSK